ncbi:hypothetical protein RchiOBHm_Chr1g0328361 [Rosa chinensis]|uniref:Uncharacterized protein n=1 Tax=Rosa chinensis TaxID=74649 RepID=A0A2P6SAU3_ROSCH|nr:hypothetical protein RchiOBHm_Chr1g0328361 [Rosa chinensis]
MEEVRLRELMGRDMALILDYPNRNTINYTKNHNAQNAISIVYLRRRNFTFMDEFENPNSSAVTIDEASLSVCFAQPSPLFSRERERESDVFLVFLF